MKLVWKPYSNGKRHAFGAVVKVARDFSPLAASLASSHLHHLLSLDCIFMWIGLRGLWRCKSAHTHPLTKQWRCNSADAEKVSERCKSADLHLQKIQRIKARGPQAVSQQVQGQGSRRFSASSVAGSASPNSKNMICSPPARWGLLDFIRVVLLLLG